MINQNEQPSFITLLSLMIKCSLKKFSVVDGNKHGHPDHSAAGQDANLIQQTVMQCVFWYIYKQTWMSLFW